MTEFTEKTLRYPIEAENAEKIVLVLRKFDFDVPELSAELLGRFTNKQTLSKSICR